MNKEDILEFIRKNRGYFASHFHIKKIGLFGSFARGESTSKSDIDILIELEENTPDIFDLNRDLRHYFEREFHRPVDVAREKYLKPYSREEILNETIYAQ